MLEIVFQSDGTVRLSGRFDASQAEKAKQALAAVEGPTTVDCTDLDYVASSGLGVLFAVQKRLLESGAGLRLVHLNPHIREVFQIAGFDTIFDLD